MAIDEAPRELGLLESAIGAAGPTEALSDYMVAVDASGKVIATWKGTNKRLSLGAGVVQYHVGKVRNGVAARKHGEALFSANRKGE